MNARDNELFKVSYLFTQKEVKRNIYYLENSNLQPVSKYFDTF